LSDELKRAEKEKQTGWKAKKTKLDVVQKSRARDVARESKKSMQFREPRKKQNVQKKSGHKKACKDIKQSKNYPKTI
jgi:FtsZ-interacting cell division protein ZipA